MILTNVKLTKSSDVYHPAVGYSYNVTSDQGEFKTSDDSLFASGFCAEVEDKEMELKLLPNHVEVELENKDLVKFSLIDFKDVYTDNEENAGFGGYYIWKDESHNTPIYLSTEEAKQIINQ